MPKQTYFGYILNSNLKSYYQKYKKTCNSITLQTWTALIRIYQNNVRLKVI